MADPGFQIRGAHLKKIAPSRGRREKFWGISCEKSRFCAKKSNFFPILGGFRMCSPPWIRPWTSLFVVDASHVNEEYEIRLYIGNFSLQINTKITSVFPAKAPLKAMGRRRRSVIDAVVIVTLKNTQVSSKPIYRLLALYGPCEKADISALGIVRVKPWWSSIPQTSTKRTITSHLTSMNTKRPRHMSLEIYVFGWVRHKNVAGLIQLMEPQPLHLYKNVVVLINLRH